MNTNKERKQRKNNVNVLALITFKISNSTGQVGHADRDLTIGKERSRWTS
jgi:hypothetical protein